MTERTTTNVPSLDIDRLMTERYGWKMTPDGRAERRIVAALCDHLTAGGWKPVAWLDADNGPEPIEPQDKKALMELLFNLDDGRFAFSNGTDQHWVYFVRGNSPDEIVCDYSYSRAERDNFHALMDAFDPEAMGA